MKLAARTPVKTKPASLLVTRIVSYIFEKYLIIILAANIKVTNQTLTASLLFAYAQKVAFSRRCSYYVRLDKLIGRDRNNDALQSFNKGKCCRRFEANWRIDIIHHNHC